MTTTHALESNGSAPALTLAHAAIEGSPGRAVRVVWADQHAASLNVLWLRDNCPTGGDKRSAFRTYSVGTLDPDLALTEVSVHADGSQLVVEFSDGHRSRFPAEWLRSVAAPADAIPTTLWGRDGELPRLAFDDLAEPQGHHALLLAITTHGAALVSGVPRTVQGTEALASLFGHVRETDFGRLFDIVTEPEAWTMSQSAQAMDPHTDDPYRYTPSGASLLHCIDASPTGGGASTLVDGFAIAADLARAHPAEFELLHSVAVPWVRLRHDTVDQGEAVNMQAHAPIIRLDHTGRVAGVRFHERSMGTIDPASLDAATMDAYYRAFIRFTGMVRDPSRQWRHLLQPGEALMFDNQRVLHGRTAFDADAAASAGRRHLRLCTVDRDQAHSTFRLLAESLGHDHAEAILPSGNLA